MSGYQRYAIYYLPDDEKLASFGAAWLGWDVVAGTPADQLKIAGLAEASANPRKYGFHGTLKPPFRLADGRRADALAADLASFAARTSGFSIPRLRIARLGSFLALAPETATPELDALSFELVKQFDEYRRPAHEAELMRRRVGGLTSSQEKNLIEWGYPYVGKDFRFHLTLTGRLEAVELDRMEEAASRALPPLPDPFPMTSIALVGEDMSGQFRMLERFVFNG